MSRGKHDAKSFRKDAAELLDLGQGASWGAFLGRVRKLVTAYQGAEHHIDQLKRENERLVDEHNSLTEAIIDGHGLLPGRYTVDELVDWLKQHKRNAVKLGDVRELTNHLKASRDLARDEAIWRAKLEGELNTLKARHEQADAQMANLQTELEKSRHMHVRANRRASMWRDRFHAIARTMADGVVKRDQDELDQ